MVGKRYKDFKKGKSNGMDSSNRDMDTHIFGDQGNKMDGPPNN